MNRSSGLLIFLAATAGTAFAQVDPGVRPGGAGAGNPIAGLTTNELAFFDAGRDDFADQEGIGDGLGPRFNLDSCGGCHAQPGAQFVFAREHDAYSLAS